MLRTQGYIRVKEAAKLLGVSVNTVRAWGAAGKIPEYRHPTNRYRLYKQAASRRSTLRSNTRSRPPPRPNTRITPVDKKAAGQPPTASLPSSANWTTVTESKYPWEREALGFVRDQFPKFEPYRAWANFEFIADDGSVNEVDLLLFTPMGFFLIEIKSRPGLLRGDAGIRTWEHEGRLYTVDNPLSQPTSRPRSSVPCSSGRRRFRRRAASPSSKPWSSAPPRTWYAS